VPVSDLDLAYLDHAASSPFGAAARDAMLPWLSGRFGNPSGAHAVARAARTAIEDARDIVAPLLGVAAREVVFTGGGTEALNLAIAGTAGTGGPAANRSLAISAIEHDAVTNAAQAQTGRSGGSVIILPVDVRGVLDLVATEALLAEHNPRLVAVMAVNNEVGTIQPISEVMRLAALYGSRVLVDAVQGAVWLDVATHTAGADLICISAHKFGGPQGVGVLAVREGVGIEAIIHGGGQERERRSGTQNVAGIVGLAAAFADAQATRVSLEARVRPLRDRLVDGLLGAIDGAIETSPRSVKVAGNAHICVPGIESESLLILLDDGGVCASAGSACASGAIHTSPVLQAMGVAQNLAEGALRLSLGATTTAADITRALTVIPAAVARLRS
jgi:cysteine desulfurase